MAYRGPAAVAVEIDSAVGGSLVDISPYVLGISPIEKVANLEDSRTFGDTWGESSDIGTRMMPDITVDLFYEDTPTTGPNAILNAPGEQRTLKVTYGNSKSTAVEVLIERYKRILDRGSLHKAQLVLRPTGAPTEA